MNDSHKYSARYAWLDPKKIKNRLVRNPNYNTNHVSLNSWCYVPLRDCRKPALQDALENDIRKHGFRNPILVYALPEGYFLAFGGSRLRAAHTLDLAQIPCLINDYTGRFRYDEEVTPDNWPKFFTDQPPEFEFGEFGMDYHYNLERARRENADASGFAWLKGEKPDWVAKEMPWAVDLLED